MKDCAIIVAGGKGLRMGTETPKQFLPVSGRPVLMLTIDAFRAYARPLGGELPVKAMLRGME